MPKSPLVVALALVPASAAAVPLGVASVGAPAVNCVFDARCTVVVTDTTADIALAGGGTGFLQSRTFTGQPGSPAARLTGYEYRIDLRNAVAVGGATCITSLMVDFGPIVTTLDYNGDGATGEHVYVVTSGGLGTIGLSSASQVGDSVTFEFAAPVCPGGQRGGGASTYFFGLVSEQPPREITASYSAGGRALPIAARAPLAAGPEAWVVNHLGPSGLPPVVSRLRHRPARVAGGVDVTATDPCAPRCGGSVHDVAFSPDGREAYLAHGGSLWVFDARTRRLVADVDTRADVDGDGVPEVFDDQALSVSADGSRAYVVNLPVFSGANDLTVIDLVRRRVLGYVNVGEAFPTHPPAVTPDGRRVFLLYSGSRPGATDQGIAVVDTSTLSVVRRLPRPRGEWSQIALSPDGRRLYAPRPAAGRSVAIDVLDAATLAPLDTIPVDPGLGVIGRIVVSRDGAYVYVTATRAGGPTVLSVLDVAGRSWLWTEAIRGLGLPAGFDVAGGGEFAVATDPDTDTAYLIDLSRGPSGTGAPRYVGAHPLPVGRQPLGVRIRP